MMNSTIILYEVSGLVAILVTVAIEKFGGFIGGVLHSTIHYNPSSGRSLRSRRRESLTASMSVMQLVC